jgi:DNA-directed RNA polymerase subunit RPC12/RpoP
MENTANNKCPKCGGEMEEGMIADGNSVGGYSIPQWGTGVNGVIIKTVDNAHKVKSFRCKNCGFLESFAR